MGRLSPLCAGENFLTSAVIDPANDFAYFGTNPSPGKVVKVRLSDLSRVGTLTLNTGEYGLNAAAIDPANGFAHFGTFTSPGVVVKVNVGTADRLLLNKSASAATATAGDTLNYTLALLNDSSVTATGRTLTDTLPLGVTFVSASAGCSPSGGVVVCTLGSLAGGVGTQVLIQVQVRSIATEVITNSALVRASEARFSTPVAASARVILNPMRQYLPLLGR